MPDSATRPEPLIFPMGHYLGTAPTQSEVHVVRVGWDLYRLEGSEQLAVWALAHGLPMSGDEPAAWTRSTLDATARAGGNGDTSDAVADLLDRDLLIEVVPGTEEAVEFAKACRTRSLLLGLGNSAEDPNHYAIGAAEAVAAVRVTGFAYELWKWGHACDSLWHACHVFADAGDATDPDQVDPQRVLDRCLPVIQLLLAHGAMYLDEAREPAYAVQVPS